MRPALFSAGEDIGEPRRGAAALASMRPALFSAGEEAIVLDRILQRVLQ